MKNKILYIIIIIFALALSGSYYESTVQEQLEIADESGFSDVLSDEVITMLEKIGINGLDSEKLSSLSFLDIIKLVTESFLIKIKEPFYAALAVTASAIICAVIHSFCENFSQTGTVINAVCALSAAATVLVPIKNVITSAADVIKECSDFMLGFIPIYSSVITASGYVSSATGYRTLMLSAVTAISRLAGEIIVPLICIYLAMCVAGAVSDIDIGGISKAVKNFAVWVLGAAMSIFSGIMGLGTLITSSSDSAFSKTAKFLIGSAIPVVGSTVSDALSTVKSCLNITKNILGAYAIIVIAVIFLPPIISLFSWKISLSVSSGIGEIFGIKNLSGLLSSASAVMGIMLALVVITGITFIFSVSIMLMVGGLG